MDNATTQAPPLLQRRAEFTTSDKDEVLIRWVDEKGQNQLAFYSWQDYKAKRSQHGAELYPQPAKFKW